MDRSDDRDQNLSTVGSGRVDALFDELEITVEMLDTLGEELSSVRRRIEANEGKTSGHVRDRINADADQLSEEATEAIDHLTTELDRLKRRV